MYSILNIHTFTHQKTLLHTLFCLLLKSLEAFSVSLNSNSYSNHPEKNQALGADIFPATTFLKSFVSL